MHTSYYMYDRYFIWQKTHAQFHSWCAQGWWCTHRYAINIAFICPANIKPHIYDNFLFGRILFIYLSIPIGPILLWCRFQQKLGLGNESNDYLVQLKDFLFQAVAETITITWCNSLFCFLVDGIAWKARAQLATSWSNDAQFAAWTQTSTLWIMEIIWKST